MPAQTISIINMKGGVAKTTLTINLAYWLANSHGKKVLVVDFDPQANASSGLLTFDEYEKHRKSKKVISDIFSEIEKIIGPVGSSQSKTSRPEITLSDMTCEAKSFQSGGKIHIIPSELELSNVLERPVGGNVEERLKIILQDKKEQYDYILIDCGPTYSILTNNALRATDSILIPVKPDPFSARGIPLLLKKIDIHNRVNAGPNPVGILGIVFTMVEDRIKYMASVKAEILRAHRNVFKAEIRFNEHYARGLFENKSIFETSAQTEFKTNFEDFGKEFLTKVNGVPNV